VKEKPKTLATKEQLMMGAAGSKEKCAAKR